MDNNNNNLNTSIHTLESDIADAVRDKDYGKNIIKIVTDPTKNSFINNQKEDKEGKPNIFNVKNISIIMVIFIIIAAAIMFFVLYRTPANTNTEAIDQNTTTSSSTSNNKPTIKHQNIINSEIIKNSDFSKLNKNELISEVDKIKGVILENNITPYNNINIQTGIDLNTFLEKIRYSGELGLIRSLSDQYTFGVYSIPNNQFETYILIPVNDFDLAFKSMLNWEKYMAVDLKDIFTSNNQDTSSTSTVVYKNKDTSIFIDKILKNSSIREYIKNSDNTTLIYGFINNKYLLITSGESSFIDIRDRLLKENISR